MTTLFVSCRKRVLLPSLYTKDFISVEKISPLPTLTNMLSSLRIPNKLTSVFMKNEFSISCSRCGKVLIKMVGDGPSITGNGIKLSCRNCESKIIDEKGNESRIHKSINIGSEN